MALRTWRREIKKWTIDCCYPHSGAARTNNEAPALRKCAWRIGCQIFFQHGRAVGYKNTNLGSGFVAGFQFPPRRSLSATLCPARLLYGLKKSFRPGRLFSPFLSIHPWQVILGHMHKYIIRRAVTTKQCCGSDALGSPLRVRVCFRPSAVEAQQPITLACLCAVTQSLPAFTRPHLSPTHVQIHMPNNVDLPPIAASHCGLSV